MPLVIRSRGLKKNAPILFYLQLARRNTEAELRLLDRRVSNPEVFVSSPARLSSLHWAHRSIDLSELLTYLDRDSAFVYADGRKASFTEVVREVEYFLNVRLGDPRDVKRCVLQRKYKQTAYLDKLRGQNSK